MPLRTSMEISKPPMAKKIHPKRGTKSVLRHRAHESSIENKE